MASPHPRPSVPDEPDVEPAWTVETLLAAYTRLAVAYRELYDDHERLKAANTHLATTHERMKTRRRRSDT